MRNVRRDQGILPGLASAFMVTVLCGCGAIPSSSTPAVPTPANANRFLAGNWLLVGSLPVSTSTFGVVTSTALAVTFDVTGNAVTAGTDLETTGMCGSSSASFGSTPTETGTVASDGTFSLSTPGSATIVPFSSLTLQGTVPASADAPWKGTYTYSTMNPSINNNPPCNVNRSGAFTATPVQDVTGTYSGSGSIPGTAAGSTPAPVSVSLSLQQGGTLYGPPLVAAVSSRLALSGSIQVQGLGCFTSGTTSTVASSEVRGGSVVAIFVANDGTTASLTGNILDTGSMRLSINSVVVRGAQCNENYEFFLNPLIVQR